MYWRYNSGRCFGGGLCRFWIHACTAFRASHVRRSGHPASNQFMTSCRFHRTEPPSRIGLGNFPAEFNRQICRSETASISASSRAEMARAVFRSRHLCCCFGWTFWSVISMPFHIGSVVAPLQASTGHGICTSDTLVGGRPQRIARFQAVGEGECVLCSYALLPTKVHNLVSAIVIGLLLFARCGMMRPIMHRFDGGQVFVQLRQESPHCVRLASPLVQGPEVGRETSLKNS